MKDKAVFLLANPKGKLTTCLFSMDWVNQRSTFKGNWTSFFFPLFFFYILLWCQVFERIWRKSWQCEAEGERSRSWFKLSALALFPVAVVQCQDWLHADFKCNSDHTLLWWISGQEIEMVEHSCCQECWHPPQSCELGSTWQVLID